MSDWQVGDLALCVDDGIRDLSHKVLRRGAVYIVEELDIDPAFAEIGLFLAGVPRPWSDHWQQAIGYSETRFRKITPKAPDAFDLSVIEQMTGAPVEVVA